MKTNTYDIDKYKSLARQTVAEGCVLLENRNQALPIGRGETVAVFGRCAFNYYKSGLGSGGLVNTAYVVSILDALRDSTEMKLHEGVMNAYQSWTEDHPVDEGQGWGTVPWSQEEMPVSDELMELAEDADAAIAMIGRTAGEDQDNSATEGSYLLTQREREMIEQVCRHFKKSIIVLNVGNIIDMSWVEEYHPAAVLYAWQGGQEGGNGVADVLLGRVSPSGKLTDTIAKNITDYPSHEFYGGENKNYYTEDIYVGYRYFETFHREQVLYPFGYGLSYTDFSITVSDIELTDAAEDKDAMVHVEVKVKNTGAVAGKEVVQVYIEAAQGKLGKPDRVLAGFVKTAELKPGEEQRYTVDCPFSYFASFDDCGVTGHKCCWVLEAGEYTVYAGSDVRSAARAGIFCISERVLEQNSHACGPKESFERWHCVTDHEGRKILETEALADGGLKNSKVEDTSEEQNIAEKEHNRCTGNQGYLFRDVAEHKVTMDEFLAQLNEQELTGLFYGEGMCSPKVTPGTAGAFGGVTKSLAVYGIPIACCADGPSGIRMDCGTIAFSLPNGTLIGSTFNAPLAEDLYQMLGAEMAKNRIDTILGPGVNIHRHPLNGRNFEYFSEDPILTGLMAAAQLRGLHREGVTGTVKHFCANNQEHRRTLVDSVVSMRALREIYLRTFELAVKAGQARSIMTSYNPVNGIWAAGNYDLCTTILRGDWGYKGIVMTDWWAMANWEGEAGARENKAPIIIAQNDIYMCCSDPETEPGNDNINECIADGRVTRDDLVRNAKNILGFILQSKATERMMSGERDESVDEVADHGEDMIGLPNYSLMGETNEIVLNSENMNLTDGDIIFGISVEQGMEYKLELTVTSPLGELAQLPVSVYVDNIFHNMISCQGTNDTQVKKEMTLSHPFGNNHYIKLKKQGRGLTITSITLYKK